MTEGDELDQNSSDAFKNTLDEHFEGLEDYRRQGSIKHRLIDILFITICAVISGANDLKAVALYAKRKQRWLLNTLDLENGVPAYTTFWTVFALLNPKTLEQCFIGWVQSQLPSVNKANHDRNISIDGKAQRGTIIPGEPHSFVHIVSAWVTTQHLTLGQLKVDSKTNEIIAIPQLLEMIDINGATVTIDAMGCQTLIADTIIDKGGDYILALKGNQGKLSDEVKNYFCQAESQDFEYVAYDGVGSKTCAHGRVEKRVVYTTEDIDWLPQKEEWTQLKTIIMVKSERTVLGQEASIERRYYISSLPAQAFRIANAIRGHWGIENQVHWVLDVAFREDEQNANAGNIAENMSMMRRIALNLLKQEKTAKCGIEIKRQMAGWDNEYLLQVLNVKKFS
jgi:predicted transposase YbfD/YdcC